MYGLTKHEKVKGYEHFCKARYVTEGSNEKHFYEASVPKKWHCIKCKLNQKAMFSKSFKPCFFFTTILLIRARY